MKMKPVLLIDLIGKDIDGKMANIHSHKNGKSLYSELDEPPMIRKMKRVEIRKEKRETWIYWIWHLDNSDNLARGYNDCGYSGHIFDEDVRKTQILLEV